MSRKALDYFHNYAEFRTVAIYPRRDAMLTMKRFKFELSSSDAVYPYVTAGNLSRSRIESLVTYTVKCRLEACDNSYEDSRSEKIL